MKRGLSARAKLVAKNVTHSKRIALACSPSATYARVRSSASPPPSERARRWCRRFMPSWPRAVAPPHLLQRSRELNARPTLIYKRRSFPHLWCHPPFRYRGFDESLIWLAILFLERRFRDFERFGNIDVLDPLSRIKGRSAVFEIPKETVLRIFCLAGKIKKAGRRLFAFVGGRRHEKKKVSRRVFEKVDAVREQLHRADDAGSGKLDPEVSEVQD